MTAPPRQAPHEQRLSVLLAAYLALLIVVSFLFPAAAYPLQGLVVGLVLLAGAAGMLARLLTVDAAQRTTTLAALGSMPLLAALGLILWALARWRMMDVTAPGREWVIALLWWGVALLAGIGAALVSRQFPGRRDSAAILRLLLMLAALGFGLQALYQYFISYPETLAMLRAQVRGPVSDITTQSLLHALAERRVGGPLGNPNLFAAQLVTLAFFCLSALGRGEPRAWRWAGALGFAAALAGIVLTRSRGGMLTFLLAAVLAGILLLRGWRGRSAKGRHPATALALLALLWTGALLDNQALAAEGGWAERLGNIATIRERLFYWQIAAKVWSRHLLIGEGPGGFVLHYLTFKSPLARESQYAHSWFFQIGAELGLIGLGLACLFWASLAALLFRKRTPPPLGSAEREHPDRAQATWLILAVLIMAFNGLFEFSLQWRAFLIQAGLLAGLAVGLCAPAAPALTPARRWRGLLGLAMALTIGLAALIMTPRHGLAEYYKWRGKDAEREAQEAQEPPETQAWLAAAEDYGRAARLLPDTPAYLVAQAGALSQAGEAEAAWPLLERAAQLDPYSASIHATMAQWLRAHGRTAEALAQLDEAIQRYPSNVEYRLERARLRLGVGNPGAAREDLDYIEKKRLPVWEYQAAPYNALRAAVGLQPVALPN